MDVSEFRRQAHIMADRMADYYEQIGQFPVKSKVKPGEVIQQLPLQAPSAPQPMEGILADFDEIILPGMTHWQSPGFFAYFPANASYPSILAEMLTASIGAQCMIWETSPAAAELEERMMQWLQHLCHLPPHWTGVIQDTASTSTLAALLSARERATAGNINRHGLSGSEKLRVYCSTEAHSSVEKAVKIAGIGSNNLIKVPVNGAFEMDSGALRQLLEEDIAAGYKPICIVATIGTTGCTAIDPLPEIGKLCQEYGAWFHIDAAYAGSALLLDEYRHLDAGIALADSFVFNPHKWLFTNFDCSAYFVRDADQLIQTFEILPEYLKTSTRGQVNDYRDWGIPLGRRFRALKLWFVLRSFGAEGLRQRIAMHLDAARWLEIQVSANPLFELMAPVTFSVVCFRLNPPKRLPEQALDELNTILLQQLNQSGKIFVTHTRLNGKYTIRMSIAGTLTEKKHVEMAWGLIGETAYTLVAFNDIPN